MQHIDTRRLLQISPGQMDRRPYPGRAVRQLPALACLRFRDQILQRIHIGICTHRDHVWRGKDHRQRREILLGIVGQVVIQILINRLRTDSPNRDGVPIGICPFERSHADRTARPGTILNHNRLFEKRRHGLRDRPAGHIGRPAGRIRNNQCDRFIRIRFCLGGQCCTAHRDRAQHPV